MDQSPNWKYDIVAFNREDGTIEVLLHDLNKKFCIELPIYDNAYPIGEELDSYIKGFFPTYFVTRNSVIQAGVKNEDYFTQLVAKSEEDIYRDTANKIRSIRNTYLAESDWLVLPDTGFSENAVSVFKKYRQELRDVPQQSGFPFIVEWPKCDGEWVNHEGAKTYDDVISKN
jgi:hypothetical protein